MRSNNYQSEKIIDSLYNKGYTNFLTIKDFMMVKNKIKKEEYNIYELYKDSEKLILYTKKEPNIKLLKIDSVKEIRHQDILGKIFSLGIENDMFGDIIKLNNKFYIFIFEHLAEYLKYNFTEINKNKITITETNLSEKENFIRNYETTEYIVSSLRIDNVVSTIIKESRNKVIERFKNSEIILNSEEQRKSTKILKENDIFSIRKKGKYKFSKILKRTKKNGYIIEILVYK